MTAPSTSLVPSSQFKREYLSPLHAVKDFFDALQELRSSGTDRNERLLELCDSLTRSGERLVLCLERQMKLLHMAQETTHEVSGAFRLSLHRLMYLRNECENLKQFSKEMRLAECNIDARPFELESSAQKERQKSQRNFVVGGNRQLEGSTSSLHKAVSYEDFKKHRDLQLDSQSRSGSFDISGQRKTKSETDLTVTTLKKKVETLTTNNSRLRDGERKLLKDTVKLTRKCKTLEQERDRAEDRLKIEQTQRDSIELLRQRNKELEEQLRSLCKLQEAKESGNAAS